MGNGGSSGQDTPRSFLLLDVQVPPNQKKKMRGEAALFNSCLSPQFFGAGDRGSMKRALTPGWRSTPQLPHPILEQHLYQTDRSSRISGSPQPGKQPGELQGLPEPCSDPGRGDAVAAGGWDEPAAGAGAVTRQLLTLLRCLADVWQPGRSRNVMQSTRDGVFFLLR